MHTVCSLQPKDQEGGSWQDRKILDDTTLLQKPMAPPSPILPRLHGERGFLHLPHNYEAAQITVRLSAADHAAHMGPPALEVTRCPAPSLLVSQKASWVSGGGAGRCRKSHPCPISTSNSALRSISRSQQRTWTSASSFQPTSAPLPCWSIREHQLRQKA
jgi:hypothetical protein